MSRNCWTKYKRTCNYWHKSKWSSSKSVNGYNNVSANASWRFNGLLVKIVHTRLQHETERITQLVDDNRATASIFSNIKGSKLIDPGIYF